MKLIPTDNRLRPHLPTKVPFTNLWFPLILKFAIYIHPKILTPGNTWAHCYHSPWTLPKTFHNSYFHTESPNMHPCTKSFASVPGLFS